MIAAIALLLAIRVVGQKENEIKPLTFQVPQRQVEILFIPFILNKLVSVLRACLINC